MRDVFLKKLTEIAEDNKNLILITGDLGFGVLDNFIKKFPKQFLNAGVAEQNMTGLASGMALEGKVVFTYSIANFPSLRCLEQIRNDACYHGANLKVVSVGAGFSYGQLGISHHATEDITIMRSLPGITICSPGCDWEVEECTKAIFSTEGAAYLRLDRKSAGNTRIGDEKFDLRKARVIKEGKDLTIISTGGILCETLEAAKMLEAEKISARIISVHTIKPFDEDTIIQAASDTAGVLVVEEHTIDGGLGGLVAERLLESDVRPGFFKRIGLKSEFSSVVGDQDFLRDYYKLSARHIFDYAIMNLRKNTKASKTTLKAASNSL